jgi:CheY-like chemotaxis protein
MVTTMRDKEVFLLAPLNHSNNPGANHSAGKGSILVVEDDAPTLRLERVLLEEEGYSVEVVASGEGAIEAVTAKKPVLVLLDIGLPGMDGFTTCQRIREISRVPIIMVTGRDCLDDKVKGMNLGADDYVTKPFLTHELATRVKVLLRRCAFDNAAPHHLNGSGKNQAQSPDRAAPSPSNGLALSLYSETTDEPGTSGETAASPQNSQGADLDSSPALAPEPVIPPGPAPSLSGPDSDDVFEGTVRLIVSTLGPVRQLINFVGEIRQNPRFRLLRLVANHHQEGMEIWLGLREPLPLRSALGEMKGVSEVKVSPGTSSETGSLSSKLS